MDSKKVRQTFLDFFEKRGHKIVPSAPIVTKDDPTLLFTNAGMNQFKDSFLGNKKPPADRVADTQKCLRVSGKHNDLEEVGVDSYHHTMFEMLGNWSFGDYFKDEAIHWAWKLLTETYKIDSDRLYVTVFSGDVKDGLKADQEAIDYWKEWLPREKILTFGKKENFWEMGETGPCGPCSEIHMDLRSAEERRAVPGDTLVNRDHPQVVELWNLVFIQYNRSQDGKLEELPEKHIDTGMGLERLCMVLQGVLSNYDTDLFLEIIKMIEGLTGIKYHGSYLPDAKSDISMRVLADHIRAVCCTIADGTLPSNTGAGYVVRRILRRAVRYYYSFLNRREPILHHLVPVVSKQFAEIFPEIEEQEEIISSIVIEEEKSFLRTLEAGLKRWEALDKSTRQINGEFAFELYDTYGFPIDLTRLLAAEEGVTLDETGFEEALAAQRNRSKADAKKSIGDWVTLIDQPNYGFVGYDTLTIDEAWIVKYRIVLEREEEIYQVVLEETPFYPEGGGQVGDTGFLEVGDEMIKVEDTFRENDLIVHRVDRLPPNPDAKVLAKVDDSRRRLIENNHTATHLLHAALRRVLGDHVTQKGSLVTDTHLRFDFSHYQKLTSEEIRKIERLVNQKIRDNIGKIEDRAIPLEEAKEAGAMMLFGEKYGETVRMITFDPKYSVELCGGCHVRATGTLGMLKIVSESSVAAGIRRIEAVTGEETERYLDNVIDDLTAIRRSFKNPTQVVEQVKNLIEENKLLHREIENLKSIEVGLLKDGLKNQVEEIDGINYLAARIKDQDTKSLKSLAYQLEKELGNAFIVFGAENNQKPQLMVTISDNLTKERGFHAGEIIRQLAREIRGGGGGQPFFATAGGKDVGGIDQALLKSREFLPSSN